MSVVAAAIVGSAVVGAASASASAGAQADAADKASATDERIAQRNIEFQTEMADQQRADFAPWRDVGKGALDKVWQGVQSGEFDVGTIDVTKDPGYQFRMSEGIKALDASASARGRVLSGAQDKAVTNYAQNLASQEYAQAYARDTLAKDRKFNMLSGLSAGGQASAAGQAQSSAQLASNTGNILANSAVNQTNAIQAGGAARAGAYTGQAQSVNQAAQNWLTYKQLQPTVNQAPGT